MRQIKNTFKWKEPCREIWRTLEGVFALATQFSYPVDVKMQTLKMRLASIPAKKVMDELRIQECNYTLPQSHTSAAKHEA